MHPASFLMTRQNVVYSLLFFVSIFLSITMKVGLLFPGHDDGIWQKLCNSCGQYSSYNPFLIHVFIFHCLSGASSMASLITGPTRHAHEEGEPANLRCVINNCDINDACAIQWIGPDFSIITHNTKGMKCVYATCMHHVRNTTEMEGA